MKKIIFFLVTFCVANAIVFAAGTCKDHGTYSGSYCTECAYNKGYNAGSSASNSGKKYDDRVCRTEKGGNYIQSTRVPIKNQNKVKDCIDGYNSAYGEKIWCNDCGGYFPVAGHSCKRK